MTDDIVVRLRELTSRVDNETLNRMWATNYDADTYLWLKDYETVRDATDEIERLRKLTGSLATLMMPFALLMTKEEQETAVKAVRGEL